MPRRLLLALSALAILAPAPEAAQAGGPSIIAAPIHVVRAGQGTMEYRDIGHGRPIILIMGLSGTMDSWEPPFIDALAAHRRVITFDNEGIRHSTLGRGTLTIARMGEDTASLVRALHLQQADVLGWSMGGMIAQAMVDEHPALVRRLVLCATAPGDGHATPPTQAVVQQLQGGGIGAVLGLVFPANQPAALAAFLAGLAAYPNSDPASKPAVESAQTAAIGHWLAGQDRTGHGLGRIQQPTLVGEGAQDQLLPVANSRHLAAKIRHAKLLIYPDAAHGFLFQDQASFLPAVQRFLDAPH